MHDSSPAVSKGSLAKLISKIDADRGIDLSQYREAYLERRIAARLRMLDLHSYRQYAERLDADPAEYDALISTLTINVTDFFRDRPVWDILRKDVLQPMIAQKASGRSRTIRVWCAGCATGEEPYSVAMTLADLLGEDVSRYLIGVMGTDLDDEALAKAEAGIFEADKAAHIPPRYQVRFTRKLPDGRFEILPEIRRLVRYSHFSLFDDSPMRVVDVVLCRNVFIYFNREQQNRALEGFWRSLSRGGYLVLGRSEKLSPEMARQFEVVDGKERVYRKPLRV